MARLAVVVPVGAGVLAAVVEEADVVVLGLKGPDLRLDEGVELGEVTSRMSNMAGDVGAKAGQQWDKLETIFEERVAKSLNKLGVPSAKDVDALIKRIDALSAQVAKLSKGGAKSPAAEAAAKRPAAKKAAAKKAPATKAPAKKAPAKKADKPAAAA